jgi:hypothetical protein
MVGLPLTSCTAAAARSSTHSLGREKFQGHTVREAITHLPASLLSLLTARHDTHDVTRALARRLPSHARTATPRPGHPSARRPTYVRGARLHLHAPPRAGSCCCAAGYYGDGLSRATDKTPASACAQHAGPSAHRSIRAWRLAQWLVAYYSTTVGREGEREREGGREEDPHPQLA